MMLYSFLLIVLMLARPQGLFNFKFGKVPRVLMPAPLLQLDQVTIRFGGLTAVNAVDFTVGEGELSAHRPERRGQDHRLQPHHRRLPADRGHGRFCGPPLAGLASTRSSRSASRAPSRTSASSAASRSSTTSASPATSTAAPVPCSRSSGLGAFRADEAAIARRVEELLDIFNLRRFRDAPAKSLPYGEQRRLEIVRCLATKPKLLLLDEPAAGMNPTEKVELMRSSSRSKSSSTSPSCSSSTR
jgi:ABC-type branched-subunit amino acid transport system ATPase component